MEGIERKSYSAAVIEGVRKRARVFVGDSIVRKTDRVLNKGDDVVVCLPGAKIEAITERVKNIVGSENRDRVKVLAKQWCSTAMIFRLAELWIFVCLHNALAKANCDGETLILIATTKRNILTSPNYPNNYHNNILCRWMIKVTTDYEVIRFRIVDSRIRDSATCQEDYVDMRDGDNVWSRSIQHWCGDKVQKNVMTGTKKTVLVTFSSDSSETERGFKMEFWSVPKDALEYAPATYYPLNYALFGIFGILLGSTVLALLAIALIRNVLPACRSRVGHMNGLVPGDVDKATDRADVLQSCCWSTSSPRAIGLPEQDFAGCFVMTHYMTCRTKKPLSHEGGDPWEGAMQFLVGHVMAL
ncbi:hypothetical protein LSAT2_028546 [Lamellibrachia satsuma]|nr:hypothetical protein LSAT2_028546 [Lamellibrachia satsuma]